MFGRNEPMGSPALISGLESDTGVFWYPGRWVRRMRLEEIRLGRYAPTILNVVVETPKGSKKKYRYHAKSRRFRLAYECSIPAPVEYGFLPETVAEDGHYLNAMVIAHRPSHPGYVCEARPIGMLKRKDRDHHVICVLLGDDGHGAIKDISELDRQELKEIVQFFEPYFELTGWLGHNETIEVIKAANEQYKANKRAGRAPTKRSEEPEDDDDADETDETEEMNDEGEGPEEDNGDPNN